MNRVRVTFTVFGKTRVLEEIHVHRMFFIFLKKSGFKLVNVRCTEKKGPALAERENLQVLEHYDTSSAIGIGIENVTHTPHECMYTHTHTHVPNQSSFWNEKAMTTAHKCSTFQRACSINQKGPANTGHNTGEPSDLQAAEVREAQLYLPLGPQHEHSCQASLVPPHAKGFKKKNMVVHL